MMKKLLATIAYVGMLALPLQAAHAVNANDTRYTVRNSANSANDLVDLPQPAAHSLLVWDTTATTGRSGGVVGSLRYSTISTGLNYASGILTVDNVPMVNITGLTSSLSGKQTQSSKLDEYAALTLGNGELLQRNSSGTLVGMTVTELGQELMAASDSAGMKGVVFDGGSASNVVLGDGSTTPTSTFLSSSTASSTYVPLTRTVNGYALSSNVTLSASDVGAAATSHTHTATQISDATTVGKAVLTATDGAAARTAIGAGTSSFSGAYSDLTGKPTLFSGAYADLTGKPTLFSGAYSDLTGKPTFATVATTGAYSDLTGKPTIPSAQVNSDWNASTGVSQILNKPSLATVATTGAYSDLSGKPSLATVATTGSYTDLTNKPTIPAAQIQADWNQANTSSPDYIKNKPAIPSNSRTASSETRSIVTGTGATGWQLSATNDAEFRYSVTITAAVQIGLITNVSGTVVAEIAPTNSTTPSDWVEVGRCTNGQNVGLAVALSLTQNTGCQVTGFAPAGYYVKLRSINNAGTPTYAYNSGQKVIFN